MPVPVTAPDRRRVPRDTEAMRRQSRFKSALERARRIVETEPKLTPDQMRQIAAIFSDAAGTLP